MNTNLRPATNPLIAQQQFEEPEANFFLLLNLNEQIVTVNNAFARFLHVDINSVPRNPAKNIFDCLASNHKAWFRGLFEMAKAGKSAQLEVLVTDENGIEKWMRFDFSPFYNLKDEIRGITCIGNDINKQKAQEQKIVNQNILLRELACTFSHEVRHPLTNILAIIDIMKYDENSMNKTYFEYLEIASKQLDTVIRQVVLQTYIAA